MFIFKVDYWIHYKSVLQTKHLALAPKQGLSCYARTAPSTSGPQKEWSLLGPQAWHSLVASIQYFNSFAKHLIDYFDA